MLNLLKICYNSKEGKSMNYEIEMNKQLQKIPLGTKLLLHACCAPCSSAVLERLGNIFEITIYYYNPNITDKEEYQKRINEIQKFIEKFPTKYKISLIEGCYEPEKFFSIAKGLEEEKERGKRCYLCYKLRLEETAKLAEYLHFPYFATTLTLSPYKNSNWLNEIGQNLKYNTTYLYSDFKKNNGYKKSIELSKEYNLYRQNYCGCIYSKK